MGRNGKGGGAVAITGIGVITSLGRGREENWRQLVGGNSGIREITRFPTDHLRTKIAGAVDFMDLDELTIPSLSHRMADSVVEEALAEAGIAAETDGFPGDLFVAAPPIEYDWHTREMLSREMPIGENNPYSRGRELKPAPPEFARYHSDFINGTLADKLAEKFGVTGSPITLTTACASGASAIQMAVESIRRGDRLAALAVGTDGSVQEEALIRFMLLSALSNKNDPPQEASKPFSKNRDGFVMAEGAACLVLEDPEHAKARGAKILAYVEGCGEAADCFHRTRSNPNGLAIIRSMASAIEDAGLQPEDIGYINAHGTGTPENDKMEYLGITHVFDGHAEKLAVSSNKSMIGHTLSAAGAVEASFTARSLIEGVLPPTINYREPDPKIELDVVPNEARKQRVEFALSNSFGFGGQNVSLVLSPGEG